MAVDPQKLTDMVKQAAREEARQVAREELASLCGLVLKRVSQRPVGVSVGEAVQSAFAEGLRDFSSTLSEPGPL